MILILQQIGVGILAVLIYNVFKFQKLLNKKELATKTFWRSFWIESKATWIWTALLSKKGCLQYHHLLERLALLEWHHNIQHIVISPMRFLQKK